MEMMQKQEDAKQIIKTRCGQYLNVVKSHKINLPFTNFYIKFGFNKRNTLSVIFYYKRIKTFLMTFYYKNVLPMIFNIKMHCQ